MATVFAQRVCIIQANAIYASTLSVTEILSLTSKNLTDLKDTIKIPNKIY